MIRKSFTVLPGTTKVLDADQGVVEAWVNSTGIVDEQKDNMVPGCWADVTKAAADGKIAHPSTVWGHDWSITTGKVLSAEEFAPDSPEIPDHLREMGAGSIKIRAQYNLETQRGREAFSDVKFGAIRCWSVGFIADPNSIRYDAKGVRHIARVAEWPEVSNVLMGASPGTMTASAKSGSPDDRKARTADRLERARALVAGFKAEWSTAFINGLPDSAFAYIESGGKKDADGKTTPRSKRHFPHHGADGKVDLPHLRNALSRASQSEFGPKAQAHLDAHAKAEGVGDDDGKAHEHDEQKAMCCDDCKGTDCPGCCDDCCKGAGAKSGGGVAGDPPGVPYMEGDEAVHNGPLMQVLDGINTLIAQEIAEGGYTEYSDIISLCCLAQDAIWWARGETTEYGDYGFSIWDLMAAGRAALSSKTEPSSEEPAEKAPAMPAWLKAAILANTETGPESNTQHPNPAQSGEGDGLDWERRFTEGFSGYRGLHLWLQQGALGPDLHAEAPPEGDQESSSPPREWSDRLTSPWHQRQT